MNKRLFDKNAAVLSLIQGFVVLLIVVAVFVSALNRGLGEDGARTMAFATIVLANLALIMTNRSWAHTIFGTFRSRNNSFWWILGGALLALGLVLYVPQLRNLFQFSLLQPVDLLTCVVAAVVSIAWFEIFKGIKRYFRKIEL